MKKVVDFLDAIGNEISIDKSVLYRMGEVSLGYTPVRPMKSLKTIKRLKLSKGFYFIIALLFVLISPAFFLLKMCILLLKKRTGCQNKKHDSIENLILVANGRVIQLLPKVGVNGDACLLNINQKPKNEFVGISCYAKVFDYFSAYFGSVFSVVYCLYKLGDKRDILQAYVAYEWFLTYRALERVAPCAKNIYFANHYDRWAVLFDKVFCDKSITLIQHGLLPNDIVVFYRLACISYIFAFDKNSQKLFGKFVNERNLIYKKLDSKINLDGISKEDFSLLIIGQPHSARKEVELATQLSKSGMRMVLFIKPHPLYSSWLYKNTVEATVLQDKFFFPRVDLALSYESTLGLEYENSGVKVLWWKGLSVDEIIKFVEREYSVYQSQTKNSSSADLDK